MTAGVSIGIVANIVGTMIFDTPLLDDIDEELNVEEIQFYRTRQDRKARREINTQTLQHNYR